MSGVRKLLFGEYRPGKLLKRYREEEGQLFHLLSSRPKTPTYYLDLDASVKKRWGEYSDNEFIRQWPSDYFFIPENYPEPGHILSTFYRVYIWCELRIGILAMLAKQADTSMPVEVLQYELITLLESRLDMLIECHSRLQTLNEELNNERSDSEERIRDLQRYLWRRLFVSLETSIYELQIRFPLIPKERWLTRQDLYLKQFELQVPDQTPYIRTVARTHHQMQKLIHQEDSINRIDTLIKELQSEMVQLPDEEMQHELQKSLNLLQNARLCMGMISSKKSDEKKVLARILDAEKNRAHLSNLIKTVREGGDPSAKEKEDLHSIICSMNRYRTFFGIRESQDLENESEAVQLIRLIDTHFNTPHSTDPLQDSDRQAQPQPGRESLLDNYLDVEVIRKKIGVTHKTMKKYLDDSGVEVIEFSTQRQLIHEDEAEKLLNYYKKTK